MPGVARNTTLESDLVLLNLFAFWRLQQLGILKLVVKIARFLHRLHVIVAIRQRRQLGQAAHVTFRFATELPRVEDFYVIIRSQSDSFPRSFSTCY